MKNKTLILVALAVATVASGCKQSNENSTASDNNSLSVTQQLQNAKEMTTNAWAHTKEATTQAWANVTESAQSAADYTYDKKDAFVAVASTNLDALDQKIKELSDKAANASDSVKAGAQAKIQELRDKRAALDKKMDAVKNATEADWNDVKTAFQNSYDDVKNSLKQTWQWFTDNLSP
jgi:chromosome segregation ATPase